MIKMNEILNQIDELKQMQKFPNYHLSKYFDELKAQVDIKYAPKLDEKEKYLEIISNIESFEQDSYNKWHNKRINTYDNEIKLIEEKLNNNSTNLTDITNLIDKVKYKIEKMLFSNKSILFIDEKSRFYIASYPFLLIINDEYISKSCKDNYFNDKLFTRIELNDCILRNKLDFIKISSSRSVLYLDINILNLKDFKFFNQEIKEIDQHLFNGLVYLEEIYLTANQIKEIHPNLFIGLINLKEIYFGSNQILELPSNLFNSSVNLKVIRFSHNQIKKIDPNLLHGLVNLIYIDFSHNQIKDINPNLFNGLTNLNQIDFSNNRIEELHPKLFEGLANLEEIDFSNNRIEELHRNLFNGLVVLKSKSFHNNPIKNQSKLFKFFNR